MQKHDAHYWAYFIRVYYAQEQAAYEADYEWEQWLDSDEYNNWLEAEVDKAVNPEHY
jgi:hypothetical protein